MVRKILEYISDLHIDRKVKIPVLRPHNNTSLLVLCGDIGKPDNIKTYRFFENIDKQYKKILYIPGNHEYNSSVYEPSKIKNYKPLLKDFCKSFKNVELLDNSVYEDENAIFIGTTLWSNAFIIKTDSEKYRKYEENYINQQERYKLDKEWLENEIKIKTNKPKIILTHYSPTIKLMENKYIDMGSSYSSWYSSNLEEIIENNKNNIKYWICGHIHNKKEVKINNTLCCVNAIGKNENTRTKILYY